MWRAGLARHGFPTWASGAAHPLVACGEAGIGALAAGDRLPQGRANRRRPGSAAAAEGVRAGCTRAVKPGPADSAPSSGRDRTCAKRGSSGRLPLAGEVWRSGVILAPAWGAAGSGLRQDGKQVTGQVGRSWSYPQADAVDDRSAFWTRPGRNKVPGKEATSTCTRIWACTVDWIEDPCRMAAASSTAARTPHAQTRRRRPDGAPASSTVGWRAFCGRFADKAWSWQRPAGLPRDG